MATPKNKAHERPPLASCAGSAAWESVQKSLPEYGKGVLISTKHGDVTAAQREYHKAINELNPAWWGWTPYLSSDNEGYYGFDFDDDEVTHWSPLPEPPNAKVSDSGEAAQG